MKLGALKKKVLRLIHGLVYEGWIAWSTFFFWAFCFPVHVPQINDFLLNKNTVRWLS